MQVRKALLQDASNVYDLVNSLSTDGTLLKRAFAENLPALCFIADADGAVLWLNRRWHEYCGATPHQPPAQLWQSAQLPQILQRWANAMASGRATRPTVTPATQS